MSLTYARKMALGAERARYRRRLQEVLDAQGMSGAALARELASPAWLCTGHCPGRSTVPRCWTGCAPTARRKNTSAIRETTGRKNARRRHSTARPKPSEKTAENARMTGRTAVAPIETT